MVIPVSETFVVTKNLHKELHLFRQLLKQTGVGFLGINTFDDYRSEY